MNYFSCNRTSKLSMFVLATLVLFAVELSRAQSADWNFCVRFLDNVHAKPFTGRVYLIFSRTRQEPRLGPSWFKPEIFVSRDVKNWKPDETLQFSSSQPGSMLAYPKPLAQVSLVGYRAQAVIRFNPYVREIGTGTGNGYSPVSNVVTQRAGQKIPEFVVDQIVASRRFTETKWSKLFRIQSKLLTEFHQREMFLQASVVLPVSYYDEPERRYPTLFTIPGFGETHFLGFHERSVKELNNCGVEFLSVILDPSCPMGHHVFADSANNGPVGMALIAELLPAFDQKFRSIAQPTARLLTGHSSGGWSSLWLQVTYPDHFGGTWSTAPDPVDFRDFQRINLYNSAENMYIDSNGQSRPLARRGNRVLLWYKRFSDMEWTLGHGGQLHSFESVFSPRGNDGKPLLLWNRKTGEINPQISKAWEKYDIRLILKHNWQSLGPKLAGKLHIFVGDQDTFYLEGATILLKQSLEKLYSDAVIEIVPGKDHTNLLDGGLSSRIHYEMVETILEKHPEAAGQKQ